MFAASPLSWLFVSGVATDPTAEVAPITYHGDTLVPPGHDVTAGARPLRVKTGVLFLNFDGADIVPGDTDDSRTNTSWLASHYESLVGPYPPFGTGAVREATLQAVRKDWVAYDVRVVTERPSSGDYTMAMIGPASIGPAIGGIAQLDCNDESYPNNVVYAFHGENGPYAANYIAGTISQEVAHSYGLEHADGAEIMNPVAQDGDPRFMDTCFDLTAPGDQWCPSQHAAQCPGGSQQNSHRELLAIFGEGAADTTAPTVAITYPADGATFAEGATFTITAEAGDDRWVTEVALYLDGVLLQRDVEAPYAWNAVDIPAGDYALHVIARDDAGNAATSATITFHAGDPGSGSATTGSSTDSDGTSTSSSGGTSTSSSSGTSTSTSGSDGESDGSGDTSDDPTEGVPSDGDSAACGCRGGPPASASGPLLLFGAAGRRRGRSRSRPRSLS